MRQIFALTAILTFVALAWSAQPATSAKKTPVKKSTTAKKAPAKRTASHTTTASSKSGKKGTGRPATTWRNRQLAPTTERYKQIQDALASKGYLPTDAATGKWDQNSIDALKRFQSEQNIESTGKINSLSLIALGLGPKHDTGAAKPPAPTPAQDPAPGR